MSDSTKCSVSVWPELNKRVLNVIWSGTWYLNPQGSSESDSELSTGVLYDIFVNCNWVVTRWQ
jgi:hypothetical protein